MSVDAERRVRTGRCHCFGDVFVCVCVGGRTGDGMRVSVRRSVVAQEITRWLARSRLTDWLVYCQRVEQLNLEVSGPLQMNI